MNNRTDSNVQRYTREKSPEKYRKFNTRMQAKLLLVFCIITLLLFGLMGRLVYLIQQDGDRYAKNLLSRQTYVSSVLPYKRGDILDRNGTVLARSELQYRLIIDPKRLHMYPDSMEPTLVALQDYFNLDRVELSKILEEKAESQYVIVLKNLTIDEVEGFEALMKENKNIIGIWFEKEYVRTYPFGTLASDVIGFTSADNVGYYGIEEYYNDELNGTNGREYGYHDATLNIERIIKKAENGNSIVTTIDANIQRIIQKHIKQFNEEFGSKNIGVLIMNPNNGEIIAMASNQEYDLNNPRNLEGIYTEEELAGMTEEEKMNALNALWKNDIISNGYEPGSTFKPITIAAALEEALITKHSTYYCDGGEHIGGSYIRCSKRTGHGQITLEEALMYSCNDALMQIAAEQGRDIFYKYQLRLGLGQKTGIDLPGEASGILISKENLNSTELATSSFGQSFNVTMLQMAAAFSSLVNGGYYYQPHVVHQIINENGATVKQFNKVLVRQTVSEETSKFIQQAMYRTVEDGTAQGAKVTGFAVGGKTGTAQKLPRDAKTYIVSFLGAAPAINPEIVYFVVIDEPQNVPKQADSSIATKLSSRIMAEVLPALGIYPEGEIDYLLPEENEENGDNNGTTSEGNAGEQGQSNTGGTNNENGNSGSVDNSNNNNNSNSNNDSNNDASTGNSNTSGNNSNAGISNDNNTSTNTNGEIGLDQEGNSLEQWDNIDQWLENFEEEYNADAIEPIDE